MSITASKKQFETQRRSSAIASHLPRTGPAWSGNAARKSMSAAVTLFSRKVDSDKDCRVFFDESRQRTDIVAAHDDARHSQRRRVAKENFRETLRQNRTKAKAIKCLRGVLA